MRKLLLLVVIILLGGYGQLPAHALRETIAHTKSLAVVAQLPSSKGETRLDLTPVEVREEEDRHESENLGKYIEYSIYFTNAQPLGDFFSSEGSFTTPSFHTSPDQYLLLRVFRI